MDFIAIGDTVADEFIKLKEATIAGSGNSATLSMPWGNKIPFDSSVLVPGVGNAANAAVAAARLGLSSGFVSNVGKDRYGEETLALFTHEGVSTEYISVHADIPTNHHYVLRCGAERTILIRHEAYPYALPADFVAPKWIYLSSTAEGAEAFHTELAEWLKTHPETKLAFQPGTFQIKMGKEKLKELYAVSEVVACNKEEAEQILGVGKTDIHTLLAQMRALGPNTALITDGVRGAYVSDGTETFHIPMYPDSRPPVDRTGAGDATTATFVVALALGKSLAEALAWGPINAMSVVQDIGAQRGLLSREALEKYLAGAPAEYRAELL
jgi:sugar/nucleoside kinase (ribokinase family)